MPAAAAVSGSNFACNTNRVRRNVVMDVSIQKIITVNGGSLKRSPWTLQTVEEIDGHTFVPLKKIDQGFCRFVTGSSKGLFELGWLDELRKLRTTAQRATESGGLFAEPGARPKRRRKVTAAAVPEPSYITVDLPAFEYEGGKVDAISMLVKAEPMTFTHISVELDPDNLAYIRHALLASGIPAKKRAKPPHDGVYHKVRWLTRRHGWQARRGPDQSRTKFFKVGKQDDELGVADVRDLAKRWADGDDDSGSAGVSDSEETGPREDSDRSGDQEAAKDVAETPAAAEALGDGDEDESN